MSNRSAILQPCLMPLCNCDSNTINDTRQSHEWIWMRDKNHGVKKFTKVKGTLNFILEILHRTHVFCTAVVKALSK